MVSYLTYDYTMFIGARRMQRPPIQNFDAPQTAEQFDVSRCDRIADTDGSSAGSRAGGTDAAGRREYHDLFGLFSQYTGGSGGAGSVLPHGADLYRQPQLHPPRRTGSAPHKFYGLNGSGLLFKRKDLVIEPQIHGGGSTTPYRSGTPALGLAVSTETALRLALENQEQRIAHVWKLNRFLRAGLSKYPAVRINSPENAVPHILNLSVSGVKGTVFQQELGKRGVCVSVKSACSVEGTPSKAVFAVNRDRKNALSSWRISLSHLTTMEEVREFLQIFDCCYKELVR